MKKYYFLLIFLFTLSCSDYQGDLQAPGTAPSSPFKPDGDQKNPFPTEMQEPNSKPFSEERLILNTGVNIIAKSVHELALQAELLKNQTENYCADLDDNKSDSSSFETLRNQWKATMLAFHTVDAAPIGPLSDNQNRISDNLYSWPLINPCGIDEQVAHLAETGKPNTDLLINVKGLGALEYLFFEESYIPKCNAIFNKKAVAWGKKSLDLKKKDRCSYARVLTQDVLKSSQELDKAWSPENQNFTKTWVDGSRYNSIKDAVNALTDSLLSIEALKDDKLAKPLGLHEECKNDNKLCPELAEHMWSGIAIEAVTAQLIGFKNVFFGSLSTTEKAHGLDDYLVQQGHSDVVEKIKQSLNEALETARTLKQPSLQKQIALFDSASCYTAIHQSSINMASLSPLCAFYQDVRDVNILLREDVLIILALTSPPGFQGDND